MMSWLEIYENRQNIVAWSFNIRMEEHGVVSLPTV